MFDKRSLLTSADTDQYVGGREEKKTNQKRSAMVSFILKLLKVIHMRWPGNIA